MQNSNLTGSAWNYEFWSKVLTLNTSAYHLSWWIWGIFLVVALVAGIISLVKGNSLRGLLGCVGCVGLIFLLLPLGAWINMREAAGIVASMSATEGIVNMSNFIISVLLFFLFGIF